MGNKSDVYQKYTVKEGAPLQVLSYSLDNGYSVKPSTAPNTMVFEGPREVEMVPGFGGCDVTEVLVPFFPTSYLFTVDNTPYQQVQWLVEQANVEK